MSGRQKKDEDPRQAQGGDGGLPTASVMARALVEGIDRLHMERCSLVLRAKEQKAAGERAAYAATWELVTEISLQIEQAEADLEEMGGRASLLEDVPACADGQKRLPPLLRDPNEELPDDDITVVAVLEQIDGGVFVDMVRLCAEEWRYAIDGMPVNHRNRVNGWCHLHEAAAILDAARREVKHG